MEEVRPLNLRYTPRAIQQLDAIRTYLHLRNERAVIRVGAHIHKACGQLARHPHSGRPEGPRGIRAISVPRYPYVILYRILGSPPAEIEVLGVFHTALGARKI